MRAMILAAGVGSRLDPLTRNVPKPMVPILNRPVIEHIVRLLTRHGFNEIYSNTYHLAEQIENYLGDGSVLGADVHFLREKELLGTAGGLKNIHDRTQFFGKSTFLVIGGDDVTNIDLTEMLEFHRSNKALATIALTEVEDPSQFGVVVLEKGGKIGHFVEKPAPGTAPSNLINTGVYLFEPEILDLIPSATFYDFGKQLFPLLLERQEAFYGFTMHNYWRDVGNVREYHEAHQDFFRRDHPFHTDIPEVKQDIWQGENCVIAETAVIEAPCVIGANCRISAGAVVHKGSVLGDGCKVGENATVSESILWNGAQVENGTHVERCVVGADCSVLSDAAIFDGIIIDP